MKFDGSTGWNVSSLLVFGKINPLQPGVAFPYPLKTSET